uniref:CSON006609 protein n=1 Tax=Culicoides sonorensis TaxID=179676 RepID=A0A336LBP2_CULSO
MESEESLSNDSFKSQKRKSKSKESSPVKGNTEKEKCQLDMSHEDLSDVSDLESDDTNSQKFKNGKPSSHDSIDLRNKLEQKKNIPKAILTSPDKNEKKNDEDILDFEAEEGECNEERNEMTKDDSDKKIVLSDLEDGEELEEGELSEEDGKRPEENEPKPVCRFYTRGQCTWGMSCRFLHPGVTDKGNYTMFDMVRPVPMSQPGFAKVPNLHDLRETRPPVYGLLPTQGAYIGTANVRSSTTPIATVDNINESAWERGLRTAKEMMRKASKRKEQDIDFEDKKMNLSLTQEELEKDNYYIRDRGSNNMSPAFKSTVYSPNQHMHRPILEESTYGRMPRYRDSAPAHKVYYEDNEKRRARPLREVIVEKADQWNDPWMRSKSPGHKRLNSKRDRRSYNSNSSYSSSSSSNSDTSSDSSTSSTKHLTRKKITSPVKRYERNIISPPSDRRYEKNTLTPKRKVLSPRKNTISTVSGKKRGTSSSSNSESSESTESEDDSSTSSTSGSSDDSTTIKHVRSRDKVLHERKMASKKVELSMKRSPVLKDDEKNLSGSKKSNRREELLKQLKAVEDAIARKRSKFN